MADRKPLVQQRMVRLPLPVDTKLREMAAEQMCSMSYLMRIAITRFVGMNVADSTAIRCDQAHCHCQEDRA